eukprot:TRINITY_DN62783_c0_g1_i1.p1 TRINITY_DN62783_c0_g1~~TRINITY_DN62783_c0_g1_i1.p1  ORF type:complete len:504 (-),score=38.98 TRINITY_DN62783_c0_g1_i1:203-1570(-)
MTSCGLHRLSSRRGLPLSRCGCQIHRPFACSAVCSDRLLPSQHSPLFDGVSLLELAVLARRAYTPASQLRPSPVAELSKPSGTTCGGRQSRRFAWSYAWEDSYNDPSIGVHIHTWRRGDSDMIITARGTELNASSHLIGNIGLLRGSHFTGATESRDWILRLIDARHDRGGRVWLAGHSRGAALLQFAALGCSDAIEAVVGFESPGLPPWMPRREPPKRPEVFFDFYTYPNYITLLHPAVNRDQRYSIAINYPDSTSDDWSHISRCVGSDLNRIANWASLGSLSARTLTSTALTVGATRVAGVCGQVAAGLAVAGEYASHFQSRGVWSAYLAMEDFAAAHSIDGIVARLSDGDVDSQGEDGSQVTSAVRRILRWPADDERRKEPVSVVTSWASDMLRNELLFGQEDLAGVHQLGCGGARALWEARMKHLWGEWYELGEVVKLPVALDASRRAVPP